MGAKILLLDIETAPLVGQAWGKYDQNILKIIRPSFMLSFAYKWLGEKKVYCKALPDYSGYDKNKVDDKYLVQDLWKLFDEADIIVAHNGDQFDIKKSYARFAVHDLPAPRPVKTIDTKKIAKKHFRLDSNSLSDLGQFLDLGVKIPTGGFDLWDQCIGGDLAAWTRMRDYNVRDVRLLELVYLRIRSYSDNHPNLNLYQDPEHPPENCPVCESSNTVKRGYHTNKVQVRQQHVCKDCRSWFLGKTIKQEKKK